MKVLRFPNVDNQSIVGTFF